LQFCRNYMVYLLKNYGVTLWFWYTHLISNICSFISLKLIHFHFIGYMITFFILHFFSRWILHECKTRKPNRLIHGSSHTSLDFLKIFSFLLLLFIFSYVCFFLLWSSPLCDFPFSRYSIEPTLHHHCHHHLSITYHPSFYIIFSF